jgi:hypothetical protein
MEDVAAICAADIFCKDEFEIVGNRAGGGSIAFPVRLKDSGLLAWVKPAVAAGGNERTAAHEKIVADLGHKLRFPVAPVMLSDKTKGHGLPDVVALSFGVLAQPRSWNGVEAILSDDHKQSLAHQLSAIWALHCWIDDHDHNWNDGNALFEIRPDGTSSAVFYDYGHSLTHEWMPPAPAPVRDWARRQGAYSLTDPAEIACAIERIEKLAINDWEVIIKRIPRDCLPPDLGSHLATALDQRRKQLRTLLNLAGAP